MSLDRRKFLAGATALTVATSLRPSLAGQPASAKYRVAVIGHTGRGNYGHGMDRVWEDIPGTQVVAVADADPKGLSAAVKRLGLSEGFADYRKMLDRVKPDLISVAPRWLDQHCDMVVAAAQRSVRGIYMEKPMCQSLVQADRMVEACKKHGVKLAIAFQTRYSQKLPVIDELINSGSMGRILEIRARGKEDTRGGGEDLWVLGTHMMNLTHHFGGKPISCYATVWQGGRPIRPTDVKPGPEGIGPLAGDEVHAVYRLSNGITAYFDSIRNGRGDPSRFGIHIHGSKGIVQMHNTGHLPDTRFLADSSWSPGRTGKSWVPVSSAGVNRPEPLPNDGLHGGNVRAVKDLIDAVENDRQPLSSIYDARIATEMIVAVFESQRLGGPVTLPLENRENPLTMLA